EVPEHLEEGVVARGPADVLEVVVLAARADAFLAGGRAHVVAPFLTEEHGLELHPARVGEEEGRVGSGDERRRPHARVTVLLEIGHELLADRAAGHRKAHCTPDNTRSLCPPTSFRAFAARRSTWVPLSGSRSV